MHSDAASKAAEAEWKEKARKELEDWHHHQSEQLEKNKANNRYGAPASDLFLLVGGDLMVVKFTISFGKSS